MLTSFDALPAVCATRLHSGVRLLMVMGLIACLAEPVWGQGPLPWRGPRRSLPDATRSATEGLFSRLGSARSQNSPRAADTTWTTSGEVAAPRRAVRAASMQDTSPGEEVPPPLERTLDEIPPALVSPDIVLAEDLFDISPPPVALFPSEVLSSRYVARGELLLWWLSGMHVPELVTSSPVGVDPSMAGVLGQPDTRLLFGGQGINDDLRVGGRVGIEAALDPLGRYSLDVEYLILDDASDDFRQASGGNPILARPFTEACPPDPQVQNALACLPQVATARIVAGSTIQGPTSGFVSVDTSTELQAFQLSLRRHFLFAPTSRLSLRGGYQYARLEDGVLINDSSLVQEPVNPLVPAGTTIDLRDRFESQNEFHGIIVGVEGELVLRRLTLELFLNLALGNTRQAVQIEGQTVTQFPPLNPMDPPPAPEIISGGLLTQASNIGVYARDEFSVIPQLGVNLNYDLSARSRITLGYSLFYWSKVARSGEQIDTLVNSTQQLPTVSGALVPRFPFANNDFWAHGLNLGLELYY